MSSRNRRSQVEECSTCGRTDFYDEDGYTYCGDGHRQEGLATQTETEFGKRGGDRISVKRAPKVKISQVLRGVAANALYLEAYQLVLRKQCFAFIHTIGFPAEFEQIVQDLWALRLQLLQSKLVAVSNDADTMYSSQVSQSEGEVQAEGTKVVLDKLPSLVQSMALCYMAAMILRLPLSFGDLAAWIRREDIPYVRAVRHVPVVMRSRLPPGLLIALDSTVIPDPDHVRKAFQALLPMYQSQFGLSLPPLNAILLRLKHVMNLALPISTHLAAASLTKLLEIDFRFPDKGRRTCVIDQPEVALMSSIIIVTKLFFPFHAKDQPVESTRSPVLLGLDWTAWVKKRKEQKTTADTSEPKHLTRGTEMEVTEYDVPQMSNEQMDDYLDWYNDMWVDKERVREKSRDLSRELLDIFPVHRSESSIVATYDYKTQKQLDQDNTDDRILHTVRNLLVRDVVDDAAAGAEKDRKSQIGSTYKRYRHAHELSDEAAYTFHAAAAEAVALPLKSMLVAVLQLERRLLQWRKENPQN